MAASSSSTTSSPLHGNQARRALLIGVSGYDGRPYPPLKSPRRDVGPLSSFSLFSLFHLFSLVCFGLALFALICKLFTDALKAVLEPLHFIVTVVYDLNRQQMRDVMKEFRKSLEPNCFVFFHFSGHGVQFRNTGYFVPLGVNDASPDPEDVEDIFLNMNWVCLLFVLVVKKKGVDI